MSIAALNWVKGMHKSRIKSSPRTVLREMADFADELNECWPSVETLSNCTSLSERAVQESLRALEAMGLITTFQRFRRSSRYRLNRHLDLSLPGKGADSAPLPRRVQSPPEISRPKQRISKCPVREVAKGAESAPLIPAKNSPIKGADSVVPRVQILQVWGAPSAPKPPKNHQRTLREGGTGARPIPLPRSWQPSGADEAYARRLGLDPAVVAPRFRRSFFSSAKTSADWSSRWELWCDEDAAKALPASISPTPAATNTEAQVTDPDGLDAAGRSWVQRWLDLQAASEDTTASEAVMRSIAPAAFAVVQRLKRAGVPKPKNLPEISTQG